MARCGVRIWWLTEVVSLGTLLAGCWPLTTSPAAMATIVGRTTLLEQLGRDFDGVFPCPCGWDGCSSPATRGLGAETYAFSSTCFLPADHTGSPSWGSSGDSVSSDNSSSSSAAVTAAAGRDYCSFTSQHSLCRYSPDKAGEACRQVLAMGVESEAQAEVVRVHNELRSQVAGGRETRGRPGPQPPAADMMMLEWDEELARIAQAWANQCVFQHDCGDCRRTERFVVGQNLYISGGTGGAAAPDWRSALTAFYDEVELMSADQVRSFRGTGGVGHYTQLVWGATRYVGCGFIQYKDSSFTQSYYACNYGSAGNYMGQKMYEVGQACSKCPAQTTCSSQFPGLCTAKGGGIGGGGPGGEGGDGGVPGSGGDGGGPGDGKGDSDRPGSGDQDGDDSIPSPCGMYDECDLVYESRAPSGGRFVMLHCQ